jgi:hypothetical protein
MAVKLIPGLNDMATTHPELAAQWHQSKNGSLLPEQVIAGTNKKIWWVCDKGHEWQASGNSRAGRESGCSICKGKKVLRGFNDLATTHPNLANEWHPTLNETLEPNDVLAGTHKIIWWKCARGHSWQASGKARVFGSGCPTCAGKVIVAGFNDLATANPELADQWHPTKNLELTPHAVAPGSHKSVWWVCEMGHEWQVAIGARARGANCPICSGQQVQIGYNDLATRDPEIAKHWHPSLNGALKPTDITSGSGIKIWWVCDKGHEWQISADSRKRGANCPICAGKKVLAGVNDLRTINPNLAAQWHPTKNEALCASDVTANSGKSAWWICEFGHEWKSAIYNRQLGQGCPVCVGQKVLMGFNDLASRNPEVATQWSPTKNGLISPTEVIAGTNKLFWWVCSEGHEWRTSPSKRLSGQGCPTCAVYGFDPNKPAVLYFIANQELYARKVGITNLGTSRLAEFKKSGWRILLTVNSEKGADVRTVETAMFSWLRGEHALPQHLSSESMRRTGGWTETFSEEGPSNLEVIARIHTEFSKLKH